MSRTTSILLAAALILTACTNTNQSEIPEADFFVQPTQPFVLRVGDTAGVVTSTAIVLVRFNGVLSDSRCPEEVNCIQAGSANALFSVQTALAVREVEVQIPLGGGAELEVEEVTLRIQEIAPPAREGVEIDPLAYEVLMSVAVTGDPLAPPEG